MADFHIVLNEVYTSEVPELTDEWVKENSEESDTVDEYKEEVRQFCVDQKLAEEMQDAFLEQVVADKYPEGEVEAEITNLETYWQQYAVSMGVDTEEFDRQVKESAQNTVKMKEAVKLLADKKKLEPSEEEYQEAAARYAAMSGTTDVEGYVESVGEELLKEVIRQNVVMDYLVDQCVQVEQSGGSAEESAE